MQRERFEAIDSVAMNNMRTSFVQDGKLNSAAAIVALRRFLDGVVKAARFQLSFVVRPEAASDGPGAAPPLENAEIIVDFQGADQGLLLERNAELLKALEYLAIRVL